MGLVGLARVSVLVLSFAISSPAQVTVAQISDTHLGEKRAPHAAENLLQAVDMINQRRPDVVILSGDIGENPQAWQQARSILKKLKAPLHVAPGNHDVNGSDLDSYRKVFGRDYYTFDTKGITFVVINAQLLGNYDTYEAKTPPALAPDAEVESERMLAWLRDLTDEARNRVRIGVQHIPVFRDGSFPDPKPYWIISEPYRSREMDLLGRLKIRHMLVGHWHNGRVFERDGITWHVAPATSWLPWGGELGFAMHTITPDGDVRTEFVPLPGATP